MVGGWLLALHSHSLFRKRALQKVDVRVLCVCVLRVCVLCVLCMLCVLCVFWVLCVLCAEYRCL